MRLFVAIDLPDVIREDLRRLIEGLRAELSGVRWVRPEGIHLTLKFLGETKEEDAARLRKRLAGVLPGCVPPFDLRVEGIGLFPGKGRPRVLWAGLLEAPGEGGPGGQRLIALQQRVEEAAEAAGFAREPRPFSPHLTLARCGEARLTGLDQTLARHGQQARGAFTVSSVCLFQSLLKPGGAEYRKLEEFGL